MLSLKEKLRCQKLTIGSWITLAHPAIAEIMASSGFEWLTVDLEHSVITIREAEELIRIIELSGVVPLVRLSDNDPVQIKRLMDAGAHGIIVPMVNSADEARRAVEAVRYPPEGTRSVGLARAQGYGGRFVKYLEWLNRESIVIVQIEHIKAVENLRDILSVEGVDGFIVGPYDLSGSLKVPGNFNDPNFLQALDEINRVKSQLRVAAGYHVVPPEAPLVKQKIGEGFTFIAYSVDFVLLATTCQSGLNAIRADLDMK